MTVEAVVHEILKDEAFYSDSGGGVTLSGGEPLDQHKFAAAILKACKRQGVHTAIETAGFCPWDHIAAAIPCTDLFLFDLKHTDSDKLRTATGADAHRVCSNLEKLIPAAKQVIIRTPVIPEFNDTPEEIATIAEYAKTVGARELHLLPYHRYGQGKYAMIGRVYDFIGPVEISPKQMEVLKGAAERQGLSVRIGG
jgi:pyruvate formate lyase activating enzyme